MIVNMIENLIKINKKDLSFELPPVKWSGNKKEI